MSTPARVFIHDGNGARLCELVDAIGKRSYRTMQVSRAIYVIGEDDPNLRHCDPREGRILVVESSLYPLIWAGPLASMEGNPQQGTIQLEARSYEGVLQERFLPSELTVSGSAGAVFEALWQAVELENPSGVSLSPNLAAGQPFDDTTYSDRSLFDAWNLVAQQTGHEWWLEHEVVTGVLQTQAQFRPARGQDRSSVRLVVGTQPSERVNRWRISAEGATYRIRAVGGASSATQAFTERSRVERRAGKAPVSTAALVAGGSRHGFDFSKWPTGENVVTRADRLAIVENVIGAGSLAITAEALLRQGRTAQLAIDLEVQGVPELWQSCMPGDVISVSLPAPYFIDGYEGTAAIVDTEPWEEAGTLRMTVMLA